MNYLLIGFIFIILFNILFVALKIIECKKHVIISLGAYIRKPKKIVKKKK